ncbi:LamG-like jellyroll fold domain-containing protein [Staphylococcus saprophyticus]|uniref:LamG-like jellyroll fold domain-containing protein n=1 Tax=Staphylococcus saprophyticus TaxID=29385 RepID=UPI000E08316C|nr:LamG-like jellyroll fold domain-containing protein [Staphylococcus saprophyticus]SUM89496.1 Uncharacterised protein [Staphylococcus saprophyticus]
MVKIGDKTITHIYQGSNLITDDSSNTKDIKLGNKPVNFVYQGNNILYPTPIRDGLILWYDFKSMKNTDITKNIAKDLSDNGNNGTLQNFNYTSDSGYNDGLKFDGVDDTVSLTNPLFNQGKENQNWTFSISFKLIENNTSLEFLIRGINLGVGIRYMDNKNKILNYINNTEKAYLYSNEGVLQNKFYVVTCSYDYNTRTAKIYINDTLDSQKKLEDGIAPSGMGYNMSIGTRRNDYIYGMKLYNRTLTDQEVKNNYQLEKERWGL